VHLERPHRVLVVGGDKDDRGSRLEQLEHLEAIETGHLDVEEQQVRRQLSHRRDRLEAVGTLGDDLDFGVRREVLAQQRPGRRLVVDDDGAQPGGRGGAHGSPASRRQRSRLGRQVERDAEHAVPGLDRHPAGLAVAGGDPGLHVGQAEPGAPARARGGVERVLEHDREALARAAGADPHRTPVDEACDAAADRVLDERLQQQRRHPAGGGVTLHGSLHQEPVAEAGALHREVLLGEGELLGERDLLLDARRSESRSSSASARQAARAAAGEVPTSEAIVFMALKRKWGLTWARSAFSSASRASTVSSSARRSPSRRSAYAISR